MYLLLNTAYVISKKSSVRLTGRKNTLTKRCVKYTQVRAYINLYIVNTPCTFGYCPNCFRVKLLVYYAYQQSCLFSRYFFLHYIQQNVYYINLLIRMYFCIINRHYRAVFYKYLDLLRCYCGYLSQESNFIF